MELSIQNQPYYYLRNVMQDIRFQEETAEMIVPDSYPDISSAAYCNAVAILRGKDCREGSVTVAGGIKGCVFCIPEDGSYPRNIEIYIPFSVKFENPALTSHTQTLCTVKVCSADARLINSRKVMLRVKLGCEVTAYEECSEIRYLLEDDVSGLQTKNVSYATKLPLEIGEKSFSVSDTVDLPADKSLITEVYEFHSRAELTDEKLEGNKAVYKGILHCKILYLTESGKLCLHEQNLPFSQYCEMHADYDEESVQTKLVITGYDLEPASSENDRFVVTVNILAQCVVQGVHTLDLIEDAYSTKGELQPQWSEFILEGSLDQHTTTQTVRNRLSGKLREVLDATVCCDYPSVTRSMDKSVVKVPLIIKILGYDENGVICSTVSNAEAVYDIALLNSADCRASADIVGKTQIAPDASGIEAQCSVQINIDCRSREKLRTLCAGTIEETKNNENKPALVVRMVDRDASLWDIAKTYGTTVEDIVSVNQLDKTVLDQNMMLLLPIA